MNQFRDDLEAERRGASDGGQRRVEQGAEQWADDDREQRQDRGPHPPAMEEQRAAPRTLAAEPPGASPVAWTRAAVPKLEESDDIEQYLTTFERLAVAYRWPQAYAAMDIVEAMDYDKVKEAVLAKYEMNEDFIGRGSKIQTSAQGRRPGSCIIMKDLYRKWIKPAGKTAEDIGEIIILEQYLRSLAPDVRVWAKEHSPASGQQAAEWVEAFLSARRGPKTFRFQRVSRPAAGGQPPYPHSLLLEAL
ncbi:hypothetical protein ACEWY4_010242 [Coilia grayii]|uniref:SCAN box domain-containing protein n=1 Tax=Coilia grayii TaxID=363190 RepID=A0ABD1K1E9_9TELE